MAESPYAPPKSAVADVEAVRGERPREVGHAVRLIYASILIGLVTAPLDPLYDTQSPAFAALLAMLVFALGVTALLALLIGKGHNWARFVYSVLTVLGTAMLLYSWQTDDAWHVQASYVVQTILQFAAIYFMFTRAASAWFRRS